LINIGSSILTDASSPKDTAWGVKLNISTAGGSDSAEFGAADNATDGFDPYWDKQEAPAPPAPYVQAYFWYPNNPPDFKKLSTSYIKLTNSMTWPLRIELNTGDGEANIVIEWNTTDINKWPSDSNITLKTPDGDIIDMHATSTYTCENLSTGDYNFEITCFIEKLPDHEEENGGIPGFEVGILAISLISASIILWIAKKKR
jgi:hypothetical protein